MQDIHFSGKLDYIIDDIRFVNVLRNAGFTVPFKNGKRSHSLIFVENGEMDYYFTKTETLVKLTKGSTLFIPKNTPYIATYTKDNSIAKVLVFDINSNKPLEQFDTPIHKDIPDFSDIYKTISGSRTNSTVFLASKIYEILYILEQKKTLVPDKYKKILPALNEIQKFYFENKKLSYYSDMCYMSESNFRKLFKEYTGKSLIEYRNLIRISQAHKMINSGEYTVQEAAYLTGFNNMSFFYEVYKKYAT